MSSARDRMSALLTLEPIKGQRLSSLIVDQLKKAILSGAIPEGSKLPPERELIARFQASRSSVLEALHILEAEGLLEIRRGAAGGAFVTKPDFARFGDVLGRMTLDSQIELRDIYQARLLIEPGMAQVAAQLAGKEDVATLRACIEFHRRAPPDRAVAIGRNFHYLLATITGNQLLVMLMSSLLAVAQKARAQQPLTSRKRRLTAHEKIVDAIERRNGELARSLLEDHLGRLLREVIRESQ
jgi:GntR family transcriptional regulator, transcriptional repressor for pyruvate dehydrogenase complex